MLAIMAGARDTFCSYCGTKYPERATGAAEYPRTCPGCSVTVWANPIPVSVVLAQIVDGDRTGLLVVRRAIPPGTGKLALVGGFLEEHETWQQGGAREVMEETGVTVDPAALVPLWFTSTEPRPNRVLLFSVAPPQPAAALPAFAADPEASERGVIFGPDGLDDVFAFSLHIEAARRYFAARGVTGPHAFAAR
jgi:ADP-ribose pyrophosphatase YjhB (NUDIX family)